MIIFKISLGIFYLRFVIRPWQRYACHLTMAVSSSYGVFLFFVALFSCGDPSKFLENSLKGTCIPPEAIYGIQLAGALVNAITDWVLAIVPIYILVKASMPLRAKISGGFVLLLGCCGCVISLLRIQYIKGILPGPNFFNSAIDLCIWSIIECGLGISAAAAATLRPLFRSLRDRTNMFISSGNATGSANRTRLTDTMFGDWGFEPPQQEHELRQTSSQSHFSIAPILKNSRVMSKLGMSREVTTEQMSTSRLTMTPGPADMIRQAGDRLNGRISGMYKRPEPERKLEMVRQPSVREKGISRPIALISSQKAPPTPNRGEHEQDLIRIDHRRNGSPNWVPKVKRTPDSVLHPCFESRGSYLATPTTMSSAEGRPF